MLQALLLALAASAASGQAAPGRPSSPTAPAAAAAPVDWVLVPAGSFLMGSLGGHEDEQPPHPVSVAAFEIARTEVTVAQYRRCVAAGACSPAHTSDGLCSIFNGRDWKEGPLPAAFLADNKPAVCVDWDQARAFARWVGGSLPSEAQWEYAARGGGKDQAYPWGSETAACTRAVLLDGGPGCGRGATAPVCSKPLGMTAQGVCDMAGNVWEWVADAYHPSYSGAPEDGGIWGGGPDSLRVYRGGSWVGSGALARSRFRFAVDAGAASNSLGFRPVRAVR
ncbi:MAG: SUMF1/EgtB/PvdO family nonheme iron enzyme [Elusimicrobia bacterium]|nr:SUMF1/EgtB/PvdO family nonheme iron enzyme [Elusimicrobiota bacterium]